MSHIDQNNDGKPSAYKPPENLAEIRAQLRMETKRMRKDLKDPNSGLYKDLKKWCEESGAPY